MADADAIRARVRGKKDSRCGARARARALARDPSGQLAYFVVTGHRARGTSTRSQWILGQPRADGSTDYQNLVYSRRALVHVWRMKLSKNINRQQREVWELCAPCIDANALHQDHLGSAALFQALTAFNDNVPPLQSCLFTTQF